MAITKKDIGFLEQLDKIEPKAKCVRANIAAMLVKSGKVLVKHTNDWHNKTPCNKIGCIRNKRKVKSGTHREICYGLCAEQWCLAIAARKGIKVAGSTCYVTKHPCRVCESLLTEAGIKRIVYQEGYPDVLPKFDLFEKSKVKVEQGPNTNYKSEKIPKSHTI
ncbi:deoxycytidylate deaminase [Candidatus Peregrinibacteria bacterium]|jgi:dCMP deaminase|nr:deoxycytidylate deaminase [Candidatus Peregrinibacteria bacterium]MBT4148081.1 deoxycytidylate deaminase [Candidatus Peregrinibacteria bacterium]MBT4365845.1 deoxycytidylate deaminase [Candidatus Peregrinibacteria bacterium]MBT4456465.1 deoxycytidylate deaminase [Candidatus Peregrinibacteria bacterium]